MRILQVLILLLFLSAVAKPQQAFGFGNLTIYLTDSKGNVIKHAQINVSDEFQNYDSSETHISWSEEKQTYSGSEMVCGRPRKISFRVSAEGFETFDKIIDLPLGWTSYSIQLKRKDSDDIASSEQLTPFQGRILDENKALIQSAIFVISEEEGKVYTFKSNENGEFGIDLPQGNYSVQVSKMGFRVLKIINFNIENTKTIYLDLTLKIRGCDDCDGDIYGENTGDNRKEVVLDYQIIKRKNNK